LKDIKKEIKGYQILVSGSKYIRTKKTVFKKNYTS